MGLAAQQKPDSLFIVTRLIMLGAAILLLYWISTSTATSDWGDGITHYEIARWSWQNPILLLDHWGKPFFTMLVSPFAQAGMHAAWFFNGLCFILAAWLVQRVCEDEWNIQTPLPFLLTIFTPICFDQYFAVLTECLFGLLIISGIRLIQKEKIRFAALILSFLPFVRTEGFILLIGFAPFILAKRDAFSFALLSAGFWIYTFIGGIAYGDFLWIIHQNPYKSGPSVYGKGPWLHFVNQAELIFGLMATIGMYLLPLIIVFRNKFRFKKEGILLLASILFGIYFFLHSAFWGLGINGSAGLIRVMTAIVPCVSIMSTFAYLKLLASIKCNKWQTYILLTLIGLYSSVHACIRRNPPQKPDGVLELSAEMAAFIKQIPDWQTYRLVTQFPPIRVMLDISPYDQEKSLQIWGIDINDPEITLRNKDLIVYDSHFTFGLNRPVEQFLSNPKCKLLKEFNSTKSHVKFQVFMHHEE